MVNSNPDSTFGTADTNDADLANFFARPVKVRSYDWAVGTNIFETFNPWNDFFQNPRIINRISNYNLMRCELKVKFVINGNGFHYGRAIASYTPLHQFDNITRDRAFFQQDIINASQRPKIFLDPTKSQGGTLHLPFCWVRNALNIPGQDWQRMGEIIIHGINSLKHANGATDNVTVSAFVWAENVVLSTPTSTNPSSISAQAGDECECEDTVIYQPQAADEYGTGPVSRPAGVIAKIAGSLRNVPIIGPYARASQMAASTVSNIAQMFGYSRPNYIDAIEPFTPRLMGNMSNTVYTDNAVKFTLDPKQETSVDSRVCGLDGTDEMTIQSISCRESYLKTFPWAISDSAETLLWSNEVSPVLYDVLSTGGQTEYHFPACCYAALPFERWRGTMKFRFQVVASAFHKGRIKIVYDPYTDPTGEYNTNYTYIVDLAKERDFTVSIGWGNETAYVGHRELASLTLPYEIGGVMGTTSFTSQMNGILSVFVVNDLTSPNSTPNNDVEINVYCSTGDDFEVAEPTDEYIRFLSPFPDLEAGMLLAEDSKLTAQLAGRDRTGEDERLVFEPQAEEVALSPDADLTTSEDAPMIMDSSQLVAKHLDYSDNTQAVYYGDPIVSFRQILKRYNYSMALSTDEGSKQYHNWQMRDYPYYRGYAPSGIHRATTPVDPTPYNYCNNTLLNYLTPGFVCRRGGIRWKAHAHGWDSSTTGSLSCTRQSASRSNAWLRTELPLPTRTSGSSNDRVAASLFMLPGGACGQDVTSLTVKPTLEIESPWYDNVRFSPGKVLPSQILDYPFYGSMEWTVLGLAGSGDAPMVDLFCAAADDYMLAFFTGSPVWYLNTDVPTGSSTEGP
jgi:hypothetical protein